MAVENSLLNSANTLFGADIIQRNEENPLEQRNLRKAACRRKRRHSLSLSPPPLFLSLSIEEALSHAWRLRSPRCWLASPVESEDEGAGRYGGRVVTNCPSPSPPESPLINADCLTLGPSSSVLTILLPRHREEDPLACWHDQIVRMLCTLFHLSFHRTKNFWRQTKILDFSRNHSWFFSDFWKFQILFSRQLLAMDETPGFV